MRRTGVYARGVGAGRGAILAAGFLFLTLLVGAPAGAQDDKRRDNPAYEPPLAQAREESAVTERPRNRFDVPAGDLRLSASELLASSGSRLELSVSLDRDVGEGALTVTLPSLWLARSPVSGLPYAQVPEAGREGRAVELAFANARAGDSASFVVQDVGIPAGTYELPYRWSEDGEVTEEGTARVIFYAPVRESGAPPSFRSALPPNGIEANATLDDFEQSETFVTVVPGNRNRFVVGANGGAGFNAWITNDGGQSFTRAPLPTTIDAPGETDHEDGFLCCDPMSAADTAGNIWYGGLAFDNGPTTPSRIVVNRLAPGAVTFRPQTVGLPIRTLDPNAVQDKPMMTIDNSPTSPTYGRLYVAWNEPDDLGGINIVLSGCNTRPNAAACDNADNWSAPVPVTPGPGSYIYADVAVASTGAVYAVWWDYSSNNAISGDVCVPPANCLSAAGWGTPQTIANLDATGGPVPFSCPILAQPGGRAGPSPQVDVDRSGGPNHGRVYVTWGDLTDPGTTRCEGFDPVNHPPAATHRRWDGYVASAVNAFPGPGPSATVGTPLLTAAEDNSGDDWFPWLAVDQTNGQAWADFYSTRHDPARRQTLFYARSVTPNGGGHTLGQLRQLSTQPSDYSFNECCFFGNDYGDYTGIDATQGAAVAVWTDNREPDGEAFAYVEPKPRLAADTTTVGGGDGDGSLEPGESFTLVQKLRNAGAVAATNVASTLTETLADVTLTQAGSAYPDIAVDASQGNATPFAGTLSANAKCGDPLPLTLDVSTNQGSFVVPITVPTGQLGAPAAEDHDPNPDIPIPDASDPPASATSGITLTGAGAVGDLNVRVDVSHTYVNDLEIDLTSPAGTTIRLFDHRGAPGAEDIQNTVFDDEAANHISTGSAPFAGSFRPEEPLSTFDGEPAAGTWTLKLTDTFEVDTGTLNSWGLTRQVATCSSSPPVTHVLTVGKAGNGSGTATSSPPGINCGQDCSESFPEPTNVTLTAAAAAGSTFTGWSGACTGTGACVVAMTAARNVTATFTLNSYALTVTKSGTGSGTVTSSPAGINCGMDCSETYLHGTSVELTPTPASSSTFTGWSGACTGTGACVVDMNAARTVTASFTRKSYALTVSKAGTGSGTVTSSPSGIFCGDTCSDSFDHGQLVTLTATPDTGSSFAGWTGCDGTSGSGCTVTVESARAVTASFTLNTYSLTVTKSGTGSGTVTSSPSGIDCGTDCSETYGHGQSVTLTAAPAVNSTFTGWSGACTGTGACVVDMTAARTVNAEFRGNSYLLTVTKTGTGSGTVTSSPGGIDCGSACSAGFDQGQTVTLTAAAAASSTFAGWSGPCTGTGACEVTMNAARNVTATFTLKSYALTAAKSGTGTGTVTSSPVGIFCGATCSASFNHGQMVTLTATADTGSTFTGWSGACTGAGACVVDMTAARSVTASFTRNTYSLTVAKTGNGMGTVVSSPFGIDCGLDCNETYDHGTSVTLTAAPAAGSVFTGWSGACTGTGSCVVDMTAARNVMAGFTLITHSLTVTKTGTGSGSVTSSPAGIDCGATCSATYDHGQNVALTATPAAGSTFTGWSGACSGTGACVVDMTATRNVTAGFARNTYSLTVAKAGAGSGTVTSSPGAVFCGAACSATFDHGQIVTLVASPDPGATFTSWAGCDSAAGTACMVTMTSARSVTATFSVAHVPDTTAPTLTLTVASRIRHAVVRRSGVQFRATCSEGCALRAELRLSPALARRLRVPQVIGSLSRELVAGTRRSLSVRLSRGAARAIGTRRTITVTLRVTVRDAAGNARTVNRRLTFRR